MANSSVGGINNINFNIGNGATANTVKPVLTSARSIQSMNKKNSLSAMTKDLIMQYPVYVDSSLSLDTQIVVIKALERNYASLQMALWSADTAFGIDPTGTGGARDFVRKYHSNSNTPDLISYAGNLTRNISAYRGEYSAGAESVDPDSEVDILSTKVIPSNMTKADITSLWETVEDRITMESVNDTYLPYRPVVDRMNSISRAIEAAEDDNNTFVAKYNRVRDNGYKADPFLGVHKDDAKIRGPLKNSALVKNEKNNALTTMEPTLMEVQFFVRDPKGGGQLSTAIVGVKCMGHTIPPSAMQSNIISSLQGSHSAFMFVKWTRGEVKIVRDLIFNVSQIRQDAITKDRFDRYFGAMRKRKNNFRTFKFGDATVNPFTTIVLSMSTVQAIKDSAGYDLTDPLTAKRLIDSLFLLGVCIVDESTGVVSTIMDEWDSYTDTTINALKMSSGKESDMTQIKEALRLLGRSVY